MQKKPSLVLLSLLVLAAVGCKTTECGLGDLDCFLSHLVITEGGQEVVLRSVSQLPRGAGADLGVSPATADLGPEMGPLGCFADDEAARDLDRAATSSASMTVAVCTTFCRAGGYPYAGLQGGTLCFCGYGYGRHGQVNETECYLPCGGNGSERCGGYLRNSLHATGTPAGGGGSAVVAPGAPASVGATCPSGYPHSCGNNYCCPNAFPICCGDGVCGDTDGACGGSEKGAKVDTLGACPSGYSHPCSGTHCCRDTFPICCGEGVCADSAGTCQKLKDGPPTGGPSICPTGYPHSCPNNYCCPNGLPACCGEGRCGQSEWACYAGEPTAPGQPLWPQITNQPGPLSFSGVDSEQDLNLEWTDPNGCQPTFCFGLCPRGVRCFSGGRCTPIRRDGRFSGSTGYKVRYEVVPEGTTETPELQVVPVAAPDCADPVDVIEAGGVVFPGAGITVGQTIAPPPSTSGDDPYSNAQCQPFASCNSCSAQACASVSSTGGCEAYYKVGSTIFRCAACGNCTAAAMAVVSFCCPSK